MDDQDTGLGQGVDTNALKVIWKIQILNIKF